MQRRWFYGIVAAALLVGAGFFLLTERPLAVTVVEPQQDVALNIHRLGSVEARILSRVDFEVGATLTGLGKV